MDNLLRKQFNTKLEQKLPRGGKLHIN